MKNMMKQTGESIETVAGAKERINDRLAALRHCMAEQGIDAYLIASGDFHASEYVGDYFKCREYISGFDGSAGTLLVTAAEAGLWTDGRYFLQAEKQLKDTGITLWKMGEPQVPGLLDYLAENMQPGQCLGYDGRTISVIYAKQMKQKLAKLSISYQEQVDLVGKLWQNRPVLPEPPVWLLTEEYTGQSRAEKLLAVRKAMEQNDAELYLLTALDDIAWLYNFRGNDIAYNPVALAYTLISQTTAVLYIAPEAVEARIAEEFRRDGIEIRPYLQVYEDLEKIVADGKIWMDPRYVNVALASRIPQGIPLLCKPNPTEIAKAVKNDIEMENMRQAHIQDGVAVTKLLCWLKKQQGTDRLIKGEITELELARRLEKYRGERPGYMEQSFAPIIAAGEHGAIVHYEPTEETNIPIGNDTFVLMDTGGQYLQGTTDITRTVALGKLTRRQKEHYTAVLCGNLRLGDAYFKFGYSGCHLDYLAREPLWRMGLDFNHGTGHGVGYLLNVHEGPQGIRRKEEGNRIGTELQEGMITSNEPGVYLEGQYGIRLENLMLCRRAEQTPMGQFMHFETLTMVPFDRDAILPECMEERDRQLLNAYHKAVYEKISPYLTEEEVSWLAWATSPIEKPDSTHLQ